MSIKQKLVYSYLVSLSITIFLGIIDSDPIISYSSMAIDVLLMSCITWIIIILAYAIIVEFSILAKRALTKSKN